MRSSIFTCLFLLLIPTSAASAQGWRGIVPLRSTRAEVERLIGPPMEPGGITYDLADERVNVVYSVGACERGYPYGWDLPPGTVIGITIYPKSKCRLDDLHLDLSSFKEFIHPQIGAPVYSDDAQGLVVATEPGGQVRSIQYLPPSGNNHLRCPDAAAREAEIESGESAYLRPSLYIFAVSPTEEQVRLDYFADLFRDGQAKVYIIGYAGRVARRGEALANAERAKAYLRKKRGIKAERIITVDGGYRDDVRVELYIVPAGSPKPLASPNILPSRVRVTGR